LPLVRVKSQPKQFVIDAATIAESLRRMVPGAKIKIVTEVKGGIGGQAGISSTKIQIDGHSGSTVTLELPEESPETPGNKLQAIIGTITAEESKARKPFCGVQEKLIGLVRGFGKKVRTWVKGRRNLYVIILDGLQRLEKSPLGEQTIQECLESLSQYIEDDKSPFKIIAIAGPKTFQNWCDMGAHSARAFGVDDALYLSCVLENADLVLKSLVAEPQPIEEHKMRIVDDLSAYLRFFSQGRVAVTLAHLERCCTIKEQAKKGKQNFCLQLNMDWERVSNIAKLQRRLETEVFSVARDDFCGVTIELDNLVDEIYNFLGDLLRTPVGEYFEYDGQSYSFSNKQAGKRQRRIGFSNYLEQTLTILENMGYIAKDIQYPRAEKQK